MLDLSSALCLPPLQLEQRAGNVESIRMRENELVKLLNTHVTKVGRFH